MNSLPGVLLVIRWQVWDTFRQSLATRTFWFLLVVTGISVLLCASIRIVGGEALARPDTVELRGPGNQPFQGVTPQQGYMTVGFGLSPRLYLFRDARAQVQFLQAVLAKWVAGTVGTLSILIWTAGFVPDFLQPNSVTVLLTKPVSRWSLLVGRYLGVLTFVTLQAALFVVGTWVALGVSTGIWGGAYLLALPLLLLNFAILYSFSTLLATITRSAAVCGFGSILFWLLCFSVNYGRHSVVAESFVVPERMTADEGVPVRCVTYSPDGKWLAAAGRDHTVVVLDAVTGLRSAVLRGHTDAVAAIAFASDNSFIVTGSADGTVRVFDPITGKEQSVVGTPGRHISAVAVSHDNTRFASGGQDGVVTIWDRKTGKSKASLLGHTGPIAALAFSPSDQQLISGSADRTAILWSMRANAKLKILEQQAPVVAVGFSAEARQAVTGGDDGLVKVWDLVQVSPDGSLKPENKWYDLQFTLPQSAAVTSLAFSSDARNLAVSCADGTVNIWEPLAGILRASFPGPSGSALAVAFAPDAQHLAVGGSDGTIHFRKAELGRTGFAFADPKERNNTFPVILFSPDSKFLLTGTTFNVIQIWELATGRKRRVLEGHSGPITSLVNTPDGRAISGSIDGTCKLWNLSTGRIELAFDGQCGPVLKVALSPDGKILASAHAGGQIILWDIAASKAIRPLAGHQGPVAALAFSPDSSRLASGGSDRSVRVWNIPAGEPLTALPGHADTVNDLAWMPDGQRLLSAAADGDIRLNDLRRPNEPTTLKGPASAVHALALAADGRTLFSTGADGSLRIWDLTTNECRGVIDAHLGPLGSVAVAPDARHIAAAGVKNGLGVWNLPEGFGAPSSRHPASTAFLLETSYWLLPRPADLSMVLDEVLRVEDHFGGVPELTMVRRMGRFQQDLSVLLSTVFLVFMLALASYQFGAVEY